MCTPFRKQKTSLTTIKKTSNPGFPKSNLKTKFSKSTPNIEIVSDFDDVEDRAYFEYTNLLGNILEKKIVLADKRKKEEIINKKQKEVQESFQCAMSENLSLKKELVLMEELYKNILELKEHNEMLQMFLNCVEQHKYINIFQNVVENMTKLTGNMKLLNLYVDDVNSLYEEGTFGFDSEMYRSMTSVQEFLSKFSRSIDDVTFLLTGIQTTGTNVKHLSAECLEKVKHKMATIADPMLNHYFNVMRKL